MASNKIWSGTVRKSQVQLVLKSFSSQSKACYSSVTAAATTNDLAWEQAKPLSECPRAGMFELVRGNLPGGKYYKTDLGQFMRKLFAEKGNFVYLPAMFGKPPIIMTQNPEDFEKVFRQEGKYPIRMGLEVLAYHRDVHNKEYYKDQTGLGTGQGKKWGEARMKLNPVLMQPNNVKIYLPMLSKVNEEFIERIKEIRDPITHEVPDTFQTEISHWTVESVGVIVLDLKLGLITGTNPDGAKLLNNIHEFFQISNELETKPSLWRIFPNRKLKRAMHLMDELLSIIGNYVNTAMERLEKSTVEVAEDQQSILQKMLRIDKHLAVVMALDLMGAGFDTTTTTFTGIMLCLAKNPDKQQKLREEILRVLPHKDSPLTADNMKNLPYLRAFMKESLRIYPLSISNTRTTQTDMVINGYQVPKGTAMVMVSANLNEDPKHYSDPQKFLPERWLRKPETGMSQTGECPYPTKSTNPFVYLPFGFGPRSCIGRRVAEMELEIGIMRIVRNFQVEFNYPANNVFKMTLFNIPNAPLKFKFTDIPN